MRNSRLFKKSILIIHSIAVLMIVVFIGLNFSFTSRLTNSDSAIEIPDAMTASSA